MSSLDILDRLIAFPTVSDQSNLDLLRFVRDLLEAKDIPYRLIPDDTGEKANLFATIGPADRKGVILSGHVDVVPVAGQAWTSDPFQLTRRGGRLYGRGAADMKGFVACAINAALAAADQDLAAPLYLALSHDEEIGCVGVHSMLDALASDGFEAAACIVGEPTSMAVATAHKGKTSLKAVCTGREGHSALAPHSVNALHLGADLMAAIRAEQADRAANGPRDERYAVPYTTLHVGRMTGGTALNIVPNRCELDFEIRNVAGDDPAEIIARLREEAERISATAQTTAPEAAIHIETTGAYSGLAAREGGPAAALVHDISSPGETIAVAFGTEAGLFTQKLGVETIVCGPGSMDQGHKPDEFIEVDQMAACDAALARLTDRLSAGL